MSHTGRKGRQDPPSDKVTYSESIIVVNPNDEGVGTSNNTGTLINDGSKSTLINIDDFIPEDIEQKKRVHNHNDSTLIDIDAVVEANMKSNVHNDDNNNTNKDDDNKNLIDADDDIEHQAKKDGTNSTDNTDNTSVESTNQKDRRHIADDIPYNLAADVYEIHHQAEDVKDVEEGETSAEHWCDCGILWLQTYRTICGLCRRGGSQRQRLYRWIMAIAVFVIASGGIGAVVARVKSTSRNVIDTVTGGGEATEAPTIVKTIICPCEELYDSYGNPYGTFTGSDILRTYTITIFYNETGIYDEYPSLSCPLAKGNIDFIGHGYMQYFPTTDSANCISGGTTYLQHDGISNSFIYEWTDGTTKDIGTVTFECESTCRSPMN